MRSLQNLILVLCGALASGAQLDVCGVPIDILFLQDTTESFGPLLKVVSEKAPDIVATVLEGHPGSRFAVAEFKDRPYWALGFSSDVCYNRMTSFTQDAAAISKAYDSMYGSSGADMKEGHYFAIVDAVYDATLGWDTAPESDLPRARLIILSTDAVPHLPNDYLGYVSWTAEESDQLQMPDYFPEFPGKPVNPDNFTEDCVTYDYPSYTHVKDALKSHNTYMATFIPQGNSQVFGSWNWVNNDLLGQDAAFLNFVEMDGTGFAEAVINAMNAVGVVACPSGAPTTPEPTTEAETTTEAKPTTEAEVVTLPSDHTYLPAEPLPAICIDDCSCFQCVAPASFVRFEAPPESYTVKIRY
eukprot:Gregarina_sp_Pseudo_9__1225@NODE_1809_length_1315_cov_384_556426_g1677_i0_p1_GENE_NODE_1809_length_1315_cov_384_556426_g1677_i0NODE_1809_length_1315_cov_384_556426_g1677_i0_p1_ORF_typecomplete_len357_score64_80Integrin_beta/PF00362_18/2_7e19VWA/PF00092_28/0_00055VWA_2/PF13519_6/0_33VWA_2/PF13519_6/6e03VWA_2/PF13519_6/4_8e03_NODE_1809_length_1315_cov_384_556426_g1677_i0831153